MILLKLVFFSAVCSLQELYVTSYEVESFGLNSVDNEDLSPFYDTIVFNDISDIMKDFQNNIDSTYDAFRTSESASNENVDDLLSEYQAYLDRAKERRNGRESSKRAKNQAPVYRQDKFVKTIPNKHRTYTEYLYPGESYWVDQPKIQYSPSFNGFDFFKAPKQAPSHHKKSEIYSKPIQMAVVKPDSKKINNLEPRMIDLPPVMSKLKAFPPVPSSCICNVREFPCNCGCKECLIPFQPSEIEQSLPRTRFFKPSRDAKLQPASLFLERLDNYDSIPNDNFRDINENTLNIRLKVEIQMPNTEKHSEHKCNHSENKTSDPGDDDIVPVITVPFPYFNLPVPLDTLGLKKTHKSHNNDISPINKVTIHKKKKSKNNNIKKHKKKPSSKLHHLEGKTIVVISENDYNESKGVEIPTELIPNFPTEYFIENNITQENEFVTEFRNLEVTTQPENLNTILDSTNDSVTSKKPEETQLLTSETAKIENTIEARSETEKPQEIITESTPHEEIVPHREKRAITEASAMKQPITGALFIPEKYTKTEATTTTVKSNITTVKYSATTGPSATIAKEEEKGSTPKATPLAKLEIKKKEEQKGSTPKATPLEKLKKKKFISDDDEELLYWPVGTTNNNSQNCENITKLILERETKKGKFNLSKEAIRQNHTKALEKAVFGEVDWNDIDTVAPVFMSFVGKYLSGALTLCSDTICHSMKCGNKTCLHRVCSPEDRHNHVGHCLGSNSTDSVASMESILDLPSNTVFEVVDILHDEMLGKIYGKATLCPSTKCITMTASKKSFTKIKCALKELSPTGCC